MDPSERVRDLGTLVTNAITQRMNHEWLHDALRDFVLIPIRGSIGGFVPNKVKKRYFVDDRGAILNKEKSQKSAEIWLLFIGVTSTYLAYKGLSFNSFNKISEMTVRGVGASFLLYACFGVVDNIFRFTSHYGRKQRPSTITNELIYGLFIERLLGEDRLFSFLDYISDFYYYTLPRHSSWL